MAYSEPVERSIDSQKRGLLPRPRSRGELRVNEVRACAPRCEHDMVIAYSIDGTADFGWEPSAVFLTWGVCSGASVERASRVLLLSGFSKSV
jgi:hypothetical protein